MKRILIFLLLSPLALFAQDKKNSKPLWRINSSAGIVSGESNTKVLFQVSGGAVYDRYFAGLGVGYDMYQFNSYPVFTDWRVSFGKKRIGFFYANVGYNFPGNFKEQINSLKINDRLKGGFYLDAGVGYRLPLGALNRLSFSTGYSRKSIRHIETFVYPCFTGDCPEDIHEYKYGFGRVIAKLSWELGY